MATYHFHVAQISRGKGGSVCSAAAYRSGEKIHDSYYGEDPDYTRKGGVVTSEILLPENAPREYSDRETLWNAVEFAENHPKAQLAYSFDFALQNELSMDENIALAKKFIKENFVERGMICDMAIHSPEKEGGEPNPHVHVMVPMRPLNEDGSWGAKQRREYLVDEDGHRIRGSDGKYVFNAVKTTDWSEVETLNTWRENWAKCINEAFESKGILVRVDHRSFEERGEDYLPQIHEGPNVRAMEKRGIKTDKGDWNRFVKWVNNQIKSLKNLINSISETYKEIKTENEKCQSGFNELIAAIDNYCNSLEKRYGKVRAVKARAEVNNFIEKYKVSSLDDFNAVTKTLYSKVSDIQNQVKASDAEMKEINDTLRDYKDFKELKPVYDEWYSIKRLGKKDKFASAHDGELRRYRMLRRVLSEKYPDMNIPIKDLCKRRDELLNSRKVQKDKLDEVRDEAKTAYRLEKQVESEYRRKNKNRIKERGIER